MSLSASAAFAWCLTQTVIVVASLYVIVPEPVRALDRENSLQIKWRIRALIVSTLLCTMGTYWLLQEHTQHIILLQGFSLHSTMLPLLSFILLFAGHWIQLFLVFPGEEQMHISEEFWINFRNLAFAPLTEELIFRTCMGSTLLAARVSHNTVLFGTPMFFGLAHVHLSAVQWWHTGDNTVWSQCLFQVFYTTLFGALMMNVLLRTENVLAVIAIHAFCNVCGFPNLLFWRNRPQASWQSLAIVGSCYLLGISAYFEMWRTVI